MKHPRQRFSGDGRLKLETLRAFSKGVSFNLPQFIVITQEPIADITGADGSVIAELKSPRLHLECGLVIAEGERLTRKNMLKAWELFRKAKGTP